MIKTEDHSPAAAMPLPKLVLREVTKAYNTRHGIVEALLPTNLEVKKNEFLVIVGPSGCGKTTLLNLIAGFDHPTSGEVLMDGHPIKGPGFDRLVMFQEAALFPWLKVIDNVMYGLKWKKGLNRAERRDVAMCFLEMVHLGRFADASIHELSGGMKQRVALARALAPNPRVLLMDEPFAALDALTREGLYLQFQEIIAATKKTVIFVTHNVREAACLGDRVAVMSACPGRIKRELMIDLPRPRQFNRTEVSVPAAEIGRELHADLPDEEGGRGVAEEF
ncbi:MAG: ABC transporter ATP-binding protein [Verrucomicrobiae bacterium]|nr:ABC transporter ATP-binding protein [Verrucomicrobiae bacterium]